MYSVAGIVTISDVLPMFDNDPDNRQYHDVMLAKG